MQPDARIADIVLPVTCSSVFTQWSPHPEDSGWTNIRDMVVYQPAVISPPGEARPPLWITIQLGNLLGFGDKISSKARQRVMGSVVSDDGEPSIRASVRGGS